MQQTTHPTPGLTDKQAAERAALAHYWALRILVLMTTTGCSAQLAVQAIQDAMKERNQQ